MKRVVIIGAGLGGLVAGNLIVKKGHKVTLYEAHTAPGGYTSGFRRKGFYFESGTLSLEGTPTLYKVLDDIGVRDEIRIPSAWSWDPRERFYGKGLFDLVVDTPIRNLFIGSCWANQTGGIPGAIAAGYKCAQKIE
jgi:phytoene dehydrogenase-like protein